MKTILLCILLGLNLPVSAGIADAIIKGKTESGRTELEVRVGEIDGVIRYLKLVIDGKSYTMQEADMESQTVIWDRENGVYVLIVQTQEKEFKLWMIPKSEKNREQGHGFYRSRFAAVLEATDPRHKDGSLTPRITIGCKLDWGI